MKKVLYLFLFIQSSFCISQVSFNEMEILNNFTNNPSNLIDYGDINNDGYPEMFFTISSYSEYPQFYWLSNEDGDLKNSHRKTQGGFEDYFMTQLLDVDNDGLFDLIAGKSLENLGFYWLKNLDGENFSENWQFLLSSSVEYRSAFLFYDYNQDGYSDFFMTTTQGEVYRYTNQTGNGFSTPELVFYTDDSFRGHIQTIKFLDFNNDGHEDLLVRSFFTDFDLYLNDGSNHYSYHISIANSTQDIDISHLNFDGNEFRDFVIYRDNHFAIRKFFYDIDEQDYYYEDVVIDTPFTHVMNSSPLITKVVDFNEDGLEDVFLNAGPNITSHSYFSDLLYYENLGNQQFAEKRLIENDIYSIYGFDISDFNNDNELDILIKRGWINKKKFSMLINDGELNFNEDIIEQYLETSSKTLFVDFNNDGTTDIINGKNDLVWFQNKGENEWSGRRFNASLNTNFRRNNNYKLVDINNDGLIDVISNETDDDISVDNEGNFFSVYKNLGNTNFEKIYNVDYEYLDHWYNYIVGDQINIEYPNIYAHKFNYNSAPDKLLVFNNNQGNIDSPVECTLLPTGTMFKPDWNFEKADIDGDGLFDIIYTTSSQSGMSIRFLKNLGNNSFHNSTLVSSTGNYNRHKIKMLDYDNDGDLDIFVFDISYNKSFKVYENHNLVFTEKIIEENVIISDLIVHDFNEDGLMDIVSVSLSEGYNNRIQYHQNMGNHYEKFIIDEYYIYFSESDPLDKGSIALFDKNEDGKQDLIVSATDVDGNIKIYLNTSNLEVQDLDNNKNQTHVFPNPFSEIINWKSIQSKNNYNISIFDLTGKMLYENTIKESHFDLSFLSKGIYILKIDGESFKIIKK